VDARASSEVAVPRLPYAEPLLPVCLGSDPSDMPRGPTPVLLALAALTLAAGALRAQSVAIGDPARLAGVDPLGVRATAAWDEEITTSAGGATQEQFEQALLMGFEEAISTADPGPRYRPEAASFVHCHVDTFYDRGLIVYSVWVALFAPDASGLPVVRWLDSWVGSYTAQQLHVIWTLSDQCAASFLEAWREANPR